VGHTPLPECQKPSDVITTVWHQVFVGPERGNPNFGALPDALGQGPSFAVGYAGATTGATLHWHGAAAAAIIAGGATVRAGEPLWLEVQPTDAAGNLQDYVVAPRDEFRVEVTIDQGLRSFTLPLVQRTDAQRTPASVSLRADVPLEAAGSYVVDVYRAVSSVETRVGNPSAAAATRWEPVAASVSFSVAAGKVSAESSRVAGEALTAAAAGELSVLWMQLYDAYGNRVHAADDVGNVTAALTPSDDDTAAIALAIVHDHLTGAQLLTFNATAAGSHTLQLSVHETSSAAAAASFPVRVVAGAAHAPSCTCEGDGVGTSGAALRAGVPTQFTIRAVDAWGNRPSSGGEAFFAALASAVFDVPGVEENLTAGADWVADGRVVVAPWLATDENDGTYSVRYTPSAEGTYIVEATTAARELVGGRPFAVRVVQAQTALERTLFLCAPDAAGACALAAHTDTDNDNGVGGVLTAGRRGALRLQARDAAGNNKTDTLDRFYFAWSGGGGESGGGRARPLGAAAPGAYEVTLNAAVAGPVRLWVVAGVQTLLDTRLLVVPAEIDVPSATWSGDALPTPVVAGSTAEASLTLRDAFGNALGAQAHAAVVVSVSLHCDHCAVEPLETRLAVVTTSMTSEGFVVRLTRTEAGAYVLRATVNGEQTPSAAVTVQAAALDPTATLLSLDSNSNDGRPLMMVAGRESTLCFTFHDAYGNVRTQGGELSADTALELKVAPPPLAATGEPRAVVRVEPVSVAFNTPENNTCGAHAYAVRLSTATAGRAWVSHVAPLSPLVSLLADRPALLPQMSVVPAAANASECRVVLPAAVAMGRPSSFVVRAADALGNPTLTAANFTVAFEVTGDQAAANPVFLSDVRCVFAHYHRSPMSSLLHP
jgi:hypothetical protein